MSKIRDELKEIQAALPKNLPFGADTKVLEGLLGSVDDVENAAKECRIDKVLDAIIEVEWHRRTIDQLADGLHEKGMISDMDRTILRTTTLAVRRKALKIAENTLIDNCGCRF